jgi:hypothetical protein
MKNSTVERFLCVVLLLIFVVLGVGGFFLYKLLHDNQRIAKQNRAYTRCVATVFARYTHDFVPVTITNLDKCTLDSQTKATNNTPSGGTIPVSEGPNAPALAARGAPQQPSKVFVSSSQPNNAPKQANKQVNNSPDNEGLITPSIPIPFTDSHVPQVHIRSPF